MQFHTFHIIQELCRKYNVECELMAGSTKVYATFKMVREGNKPPYYGTCHGTVVDLGIASDGNREMFDLSQPESIDELEEYLSNFTGVQ